MKNRTVRCFATLMAVVFVSLLLGDTIGAQFTTAPDSSSVMFLPDHHSELKFSLAATQSRTFSLPKSNFPVRIEASTSNVRVVYNGSTISMGPLVVSTVASFDSGAGIGNMTGNFTCSDGTLCESLAVYAVPNSNVTGIYFSLRLDRNTGDITLSMRTASDQVSIPANQINCKISMWF